MINYAEIVPQPYSGEYNEKIYDIESVWNSREWTWVKFEEDCETWCGNFRGAPIAVSLSEQHDKILVLTSDYLYLLERSTGVLLDYISQPEYHCLTVTPNGDFLVAGYYDIEMITDNLKSTTRIETPFQLDMIEFREWNEQILRIECYEFLDWENQKELFLDCDTMGFL